MLVDKLLKFGVFQRNRLSLGWLYVFVLIIFLNGCTTSTDIGKVEMYSSPEIEAEWIRNGEPIEFEEELWYPADGMDSLIDSEVYLLGEYRGVQFFVDKLDIRPYNRLYTKFAQNKYRYFERESDY